MSNDEFWTTVMDRTGSETQPKRLGAVRVALLFGTAAIALAAILTPIAADRTPTARVAWAPDQFDNITTGDCATAPEDHIVHRPQIHPAGKPRRAVHHPKRRQENR